MAFVIDPKPQKAVLKEATCRNCGCLFGYVPNDIIKCECNHDYLGDYDIVDAVKCPQCQKPSRIN